MKLKTLNLYIFMTLILALAYFLQTKIFFSPDVDYLLYASNQILSGAKYGIDIFETNPPMILYLYTPAIILAKLLTIHVITAVRFYIYSLIILSLALCSFLLKKLIKSQDNILRYFLFGTLTCALLFLPTFTFAQREHLLIILMLPYLLSSALALENKPIHPWLAVLIGVIAGIGFSLKPFFLVTPCLIELYFIFKKRHLLAWVRVESIVILSVLVIYLSSIFIFQPEYIHTVLPLVLHYYFSGTALSWFDILSFVNVLFCITVMLCYLIFYKYDHYHSLGWMLELALLGMIIAFLLPQTPWFYHVMPAFVLALLLLAHFLGQTLSSKLRLISYDSAILAFGFAIILLLPAIYQYRITRFVNHFHQDHPMNAIADYINKQPGTHSLACFALSAADCFPYIDDTHSVYAERFPSFWWYQGIRQFEKNNPSAKVLVDKYYLINSFADDLNRYHARWVVIDTLHFKKIEVNQFEILSYFLENEKFRAAWQHYRYLTTLQSIKLYERIS